MVTRSNSTILSFLTIFFLRSSSVKSDNNPLAPALYVFGDSLLDSGNNNLLPTIAKAILPPYGIDFPKGPTGRFTNGRTVSDFIAEYLKLPYSPPYKSLRGAGITTGLNYASGACGIMWETGKFAGGCLSLDDQVTLFSHKTVGQELPKYYKDPNALSYYLSKSISLVAIGSNDYILNYLEPFILDSSKRFSPQSFSDLLIHDLSQQIQRLHNVGVRKIVVFEIGPIGCVPSIVRRSNCTGHCVEEINQLVILFNNKLGPMLNTMNSTLEGSSFVLGRVYSLMYNAVINPSNFGFKDSSDPCCRILSNRVATCTPGVPSCNNVNERVFWDGYHLTEAAYSLAAGRCINDSTVCTPMTIKELVQV